MLANTMADAPLPLHSDNTESPVSRPKPDEEKRAEPRDAWRSEELLGDRAEVQILHNGEVYRLRRTRQGKLILYK